MRGDGYKEGEEDKEEYTLSGGGRVRRRIRREAGAAIL